MRASFITMKQIKIQCKECDGSGVVILPDELREVMDITGRCGITAGSAQKALDGTLGVTAFNNRLERLVKLGLMSRKRDDRHLVYHKTA